MFERARRILMKGPLAFLWGRSRGSAWPGGTARPLLRSPSMKGKKEARKDAGRGKSRSIVFKFDEFEVE
ncbi:MAG: hypothetical protein ACREIU_15405, partial [Planctomycetota bacterium]